MLKAPTGAGKTIIGSAIVEGALAKGKRVLFTVPFLSLVDQTVAAFAAQGIPASASCRAITRDRRMQPVQVACIQTLKRRKLPEADIVLVDEAHRWFDFYGKWMAMPEWQKVPFVGLSATPWTKGLGKHYDDLIVAATTAESDRQGLPVAIPGLCSGASGPVGGQDSGRRLSRRAAVGSDEPAGSGCRHGQRPGFALARTGRRSASPSTARMLAGSPTSSRPPASRPAMSTWTRRPTSGSASASGCATARSRSSATSTRSRPASIGTCAASSWPGLRRSEILFTSRSSAAAFAPPRASRTA